MYVASHNRWNSQVLKSVLYQRDLVKVKTCKRIWLGQSCYPRKVLWVAISLKNDWKVI